MMPDWMHVLDEGTGALGANPEGVANPLHPGAPTEKVSKLWEHIRILYEEQHWPQDKRLKKLTLKSLVKPKKMPELDGKAHEVRHFCPLLPLLECLCKAKKACMKAVCIKGRVPSGKVLQPDLHVPGGR